MRKILFILFAACSLQAANITWLGTTSSAKTATNWVGGVLPGATDTAYFGAVNLGACTFDSSFSIAGYHVTNGYSGNISFSGQTFTCSGNYIDSGNGGTRNLGNGLTMNGANRTLIINNAGAINVTNCDLIMNNTGMSVIMNNQVTYWKSFRVGVSATVTVGGTTSLYPNTINLGNNCTLTINYVVRVFAIVNNPYTIGTGVTINGTGGFDLFVNAGGLVVSLPGFTASGSVSTHVIGNASSTIQLTGAISVPGYFSVYNPYSTNNLIFNTQNNSITCGVFQYGGASTGSFTLNMGSSVVSCSSVDGTTYNGTGLTAFNLQTSQWNCSGNWTFGSNHTVTHQTDSVTFTNTATITSAGKSFYNFTNAGAIGIITQQADKRTCNNFYDKSGKFKSLGFADSITGDWWWTSTDSLIMSTSPIAFTKPNAGWHRSGGVYMGGVRSATIRAYNGLYFDQDIPISIGRLYVGPNKKLQGTPGRVDTIVTYTAGDLDNDTITSTGAVTGWSLPAGTAILHSWIGNSKFFVNTVYDTANNGGYNLFGDSNVVFKDAAGYKYKTPSIPSFDSIRPASVSRSGGTTLTGYVHRAYTPDSIYSVAGNYRTITSQTDTSVIYWTSVAGTRGYKNYSLVNADNQTATISNGLYLYADVTIDSVTSATGNPGSGISVGGTAVRIRGHGFFGTCTASLGGVALTSVVIVDTSLITGTTGAHAVGAVTASVTNGDAQTGTLASAYTYISGITRDTVFTKVTGGTINPTFRGDSSSNSNHNLTFSATGAAHYMFTNWTDVGSNLTFLNGSASTPICSLTTTGNDTLQAIFHSIARILTMSSGGHGSVTPAAGDTTVDSAAIVTIGHTADSNYHFAYWSFSGGVSYNADSTRIQITGTAAASAHFWYDSCNVTFTVSGHGTTSPTGTHRYAKWASVAISQTPYSGCTFAGWAGGAGVTFNGDSTAVVVTGDATVQAVYTGCGTTKIRQSKKLLLFYHN